MAFGVSERRRVVEMLAKIYILRPEILLKNSSDEISLVDCGTS